MKILLLYPNSTVELIGWGDLGAIAEPLALEYLASGAIKLGHEVKILDLRLHPEDLYSALLEFDPDVVGVTGYSMHVIRMLELSRDVRTFCPRATVVVGGHHATLLPEDFMVPEVDHVVVGEGVQPFVCLLQRLSEAQPANSIEGVWSRGEQGGFEFGGKQPPWHPDRLPEPARQLVGIDRNNYYIDWMRPIALVRTTVGCPYRCSFCSLWKLMDGHYDKRSIDDVIRELQNLDEPYVFLVDDEPFIDGRRMAELARRIAAAGVRKEYFAYCRIDSFLRHPDLMRTWRSIGLRRLFFGIEAVADSELKAYNKRLEIENVEKALRVARELDIQIFASFIVKPSYTRKDFDQLSDFIVRNNVEYPSFTILTPIPGTDDLKDFAAVLDMQPNGRPYWTHFDLQHPVTETALPKDEFMAAYRGLQSLFFDRYRAAGHPYFTGPGLSVAS
jgi:radical SAM superfamily enzyme YgiQ (UPF0313 family)